MVAAIYCTLTKPSCHAWSIRRILTGIFTACTELPIIHLQLNPEQSESSCFRQHINENSGENGNHETFSENVPLILTWKQMSVGETGLSTRPSVWGRHHPQCSFNWQKKKITGMKSTGTSYKKTHFKTKKNKSWQNEISRFKRVVLFFFLPWGFSRIGRRKEFISFSSS